MLLKNYKSPITYTICFVKTKELWDMYPPGLVKMNAPIGPRGVIFKAIRVAI